MNAKRGGQRCVAVANLDLRRGSNNRHKSIGCAGRGQRASFERRRSGTRRLSLPLRSDFHSVAIARMEPVDRRAQNKSPRHYGGNDD